jgi:hypothetical protein
LPQRSKAAHIAARAAGCSGVVALWSRYMRVHDTKKSATYATYRIERTGNPPAPDASNPKELAIHCGMRAKRSAGIPGFRGAGIGPRPVRPIATRHLKAPRGSNVKRATTAAKCATETRARNACKVGTVELRNRLIVEGRFHRLAAPILVE